MSDHKKENILYLLIVFLISWVSWGILAVLGTPAKENALSISLYMLGGLSTTIVALVLPMFYTREERNAYYKRYFKLKAPARWYLISVLLALLMVFISYSAMLVFDAKTAASLNIQPLYMILPLLLTMVIGGGVEEFGWRGILVHNLQKVNPVLICLGVGLLWAAWHIPLFFISGVSQYHSNFLPFLISVMAYSFVLTPLYLKSGSVIPGILFHALINAFGGLGFQFSNNHFSAYMIDSLIKLGIGIAFYIMINSKLLMTAQAKTEKFT